jgi:hypothetical protein
VSRQRKQRKRGRPAQVTLTVVEAIARQVARGMPERAACALMTPPVRYESFRSAKRRNARFVLVVEQAHAEFIAHALTVIATDGPGSGGYRWLLERRHPEHFGHRRPTS